MAKKIKHISKLKKWIDARTRRHLSHSQVQMARELGLNRAKLGKIDNHKQQPWKLPLPRFRAFGKTAPDNVASIEERCSGRSRTSLRFTIS
jgi:DNA-binding XRE family transcriptional regulator